MKNTRLLISVLAFFGACVAPLQSAAQKFDASPSVGFTDGIDRSDPNFVKASLLIMSPGDELWSCAGHSMLRLECPKFNLDFCFSYESESVKEKLLSFFAGKLRMGMFAIPTQQGLKDFEKDGRSVIQYSLNLPPDVKQRLWKILDDKVAEGPNLPYDYLKRGCSQSLLAILREALLPLEMEIPEQFDVYNQTRRDSMDKAVQDFPWNRFFLHIICGSEMDWELPKVETIVIPNDLRVFLQNSCVNGKPIMETEGKVLLPLKRHYETNVITPTMIAWVLVVVAAITTFFAKFRWLDWMFLALQSVIALPLTYLVCFTSLPATAWNWLLVPFNLLPLVFWKWRQKWALWFAGVLVLWEIGMITYPHRLTAPAYLVLVGAYILFYVRIAIGGAMMSNVFNRLGEWGLLRAMRWFDDGPTS